MEKLPILRGRAITSPLTRHWLYNYLKFDSHIFDTVHVKSKLAFEAWNDVKLMKGFGL